MQRRRRLRITPVPGHDLPPPDDPALPDVAPRQPDRRPETPPGPDESDLPAPVRPRDPRNAHASEARLRAAVYAQYEAGQQRWLARLAAARRPVEHVLGA